MEDIKTSRAQLLLAIVKSTAKKWNRLVGHDDVVRDFSSKAQRNEVRDFSSKAQRNEGGHFRIGNHDM